MSPTTPSQQTLPAYPMKSDSSKGGEPGSSHSLLRPKTSGQSEETRSHKLPDRPSVSEASILSSTPSPFPPAPPGPTLDVTEGLKLPSMSLTSANLTKHHHHISRRFRDPLALQLTLQERAARIKDAIRSLDTGDLPLPDSVVNRVAATSEGLLPMERYNIGSYRYHRESDGHPAVQSIARDGKRMKNN
ncbi:hypothetical protein V8E54_005901 [Elaphomyces granulatus]